MTKTFKLFKNKYIFIIIQIISAMIFAKYFGHIILIKQNKLNAQQWIVKDTSGHIIQDIYNKDYYTKSDRWGKTIIRL